MSNVVKFKTSSVDNLPDDLMTLEDIETKYKIKYSTAYKHIVLEHKVPYFKFGRNIRVKKSDFLQIFEYKGV